MGDNTPVQRQNERQIRWQPTRAEVVIFPPASRRGIERDRFESFMRLMGQVGQVELLRERQALIA
jgi:hypothetical protein